MSEKTFFEKTLQGVVTGVAALAMTSCVTPGTSDSATQSSSSLGKCVGARCGGSGCGSSCGGKSKSSSCSAGSCGSKSKKSGCGGNSSDSEGKTCSDKSKAVGCGADCKSAPSGESCSGKDFKMLTKEACEKKGGTWSAQ